MKANFYLPKEGDKVTFSKYSLERFSERYREFYKTFVYEVKYSVGNKEHNSLKLHCGTWFYENEWELLPKETPIKT